MKRFECDLAVIGAGMTGMSAALFAANRGLSTAIVGSAGEILFASGFMDLLGVHPLETKTVHTDPWAAIRAVVKDDPDHPYARVPEADIRAAFDELLSFLASENLPYCRKPDHNVRMFTPAGTLKTTYCLPETMMNGARVIEEKRPCLLAGFKNLKGFSVVQIAEVLKNRLPHLNTVNLLFPGGDYPNELFPEKMAMSLENPKNREQLADMLKPLQGGMEYIGFPAVLGLYKTQDVFQDLTDRIGLPLFEIPTLASSLPGFRLKNAFEKALPEKGVQSFFNRQVTAVTESTHGFHIDISDPAMPATIDVKGVILATGRFLGGGLYADRKQIRESLFNLPVKQPLKRQDWHREDFLDPKGHPANMAGLVTDDRFRPSDAAGKPAHDRLFAAGSILAGQDWMRMKCGSGLAVSTAFATVNAFAEND